MFFVQLLLLVAVFYHLALAAVIWQRTRTYRVGRNFAWFLVCIAAWMACIAAMQPRFGNTTTLWLVRGAFTCGVLMVIAWLWFCADFPRISRRFRRVALVFSLIGLPWLGLSWTDMLIRSVSFQVDFIESHLGAWLWIYAAWFLTGAILGVVRLHAQYRRSHGLEHLQIRYILLGCLAFVLVAGLTNLVLPLITGSTRYAVTGALSALFVTTTATFSILRYRLLDYTVVLRAGMAYSLTIALLAVLFALLVPGAQGLLETYLHFPAHSGIFFVTFVMALAFQPIRGALGRWLSQRVFYQGVYDYRLRLRQACNALAAVRDQSQLAETLTGELMQSLKPRGIALYLPGHHDALTRAAAQGNWEALPGTLDIREPVLAYAHATDDVMQSEIMIRQSPQQHAIGRTLEAWGVLLACPLIANQQLFGMIFLDMRHTGEVYGNDDIAFLRILGKQAALALDNARHFDEIAMMNEYHARLLHIMQDGVIAIDPRLRIITFNRAAERITGVLLAEALGQPWEVTGIAPAVLLEATEDGVETRITHRGGQSIPILLSVTPFTRGGEDEQSHLVVVRDLSALHALQQAKMQAERYSSMGAMAASLAHEIKNPLVPIQTFAHLLPYKHDDAEFRREFSATLVSEVARIERLVAQMLDLVRQPVTDRAPLDLREVIRRVLVIVRPECDRQDISIYDHFPTHLPMVMGAMHQLYQVIMNVITNAMQAMPAGGDLHVRITETGNRVLCRITDSGPGVPPEELPRIFEPLYTTKAGGHGLGLALSYRFIRSHGGEIVAECAPGAGLTIAITLPAYHPLDGAIPAADALATRG